MVEQRLISARRTQNFRPSRIQSFRGGHRLARRSPSFPPKTPSYRHPARRDPSSRPTSLRSMIQMGPRTCRAGRFGWFRCSRRIPPLEGRMRCRPCQPRSCHSRRSSRRRLPDSPPRRTGPRRRLGPTRRRQWIPWCRSSHCHRTTTRRSRSIRCHHLGSRSGKGLRRWRTRIRSRRATPRTHRPPRSPSTRPCPPPGRALKSASETSGKSARCARAVVPHRRHYQAPIRATVSGPSKASSSGGASSSGSSQSADPIFPDRQSRAS